MLIVSDLDGTLMGRNHPLSAANRDCFKEAQKLGAICAIATGRSLRSAEEVLDASFPLDYLIFSSGAGILDWKTKSLLHRSDLNHHEIREIHNYLSSKNLDYTVQLEAPDSHLFLHTPLNTENSDFLFRVNQQKLFGRPLVLSELPKAASEFIVIDSSPEGPHTYERISSELSENFNVVRATSPTDGQSVWTEIFPKNTSKALGAEFLRNRHGLELHHTFALGNDYNDLQLLSWAANALVVGDAAPALLETYSVVRKHNEDAFAHAFELWVKNRPRK
jgi:Cof subfamily protein (haloacid dehalogenase superfamily)